MNCGAVFFVCCSNSMQASCGVSTNLFYILCDNHNDTHLKIHFSTSPDNQGWFFFSRSEHQNSLLGSRTRKLSVFIDTIRAREKPRFGAHRLSFSSDRCTRSALLFTLSGFMDTIHTVKISKSQALVRKGVCSISPRYNAPCVSSHPSLIGVHYCL